MRLLMVSLTALTCLIFFHTSFAAIPSPPDLFPSGVSFANTGKAPVCVYRVDDAGERKYLTSLIGGATSQNYIGSKGDVFEARLMQSQSFIYRYELSRPGNVNVPFPDRAFDPDAPFYSCTITGWLESVGEPSRNIGDEVISLFGAVDRSTNGTLSDIGRYVSGTIDDPEARARGVAGDIEGLAGLLQERVSKSIDDIGCEATVETLSKSQALAGRGLGELDQILGETTSRLTSQFPNSEQLSQRIGEAVEDTLGPLLAAAPGVERALNNLATSISQLETNPDLSQQALLEGMCDSAKLERVRRGLISAGVLEPRGIAYREPLPQRRVLNVGWEQEGFALMPASLSATHHRLAAADFVPSTQFAQSAGAVRWRGLSCATVDIGAKVNIQQNLSVLWPFGGGLPLKMMSFAGGPIIGVTVGFNCRVVFILAPLTRSELTGAGWSLSASLDTADRLSRRIGTLLPGPLRRFFEGNESKTIEMPGIFMSPGVIGFGVGPQVGGNFGGRGDVTLVAGYAIELD